MDYQPKAHGREPFPWLGLGVGVILGLTIAVAAPWCVFNIRDTNIMRVR